MPKPFADHLQAYTGALREADTALKKLDIEGVTKAGERTTENMIGLLQNLDGRVERLERRFPANDA